ncbi:MAG: hypothetical protein J2P46_07885, partial [Zavarzinella sp.]|nr:hypothetical protein [Zavarzinella sp.]
AAHLTAFLKKTDRHAKTIVFCVDQEHADQMRRALHNLNKDLVSGLAKGEEYVARVTADEGDVGRGFLDKFIDPEERYPVVLTSSQLLTTGVDAPTCQNVALVRPVGSMTEFKQIIGRGTRVREDKGKLFFNILDYTGSATQKFADPDFDGEPVVEDRQKINEQGEVIEEKKESEEKPPAEDDEAGKPKFDDDPHEPRKLYTHGGPGGIDTELVLDLDAAGNKLRTSEIRQWAGEEVRALYTDPGDLRRRWSDFEQRSALVEELEQRGIDFRVLAAAVGQPDADPFDLLCHLAYNAPLRTRRERAERLRKEKKDFFDRYGPDARAVLNALLDKYAEHGSEQFAMPQVLLVPPLTAHGNVVEIARKFGGSDKLQEAVQTLQELLYAA